MRFLLKFRITSAGIRWIQFSFLEIHKGIYCFSPSPPSDVDLTYGHQALLLVWVSHFWDFRQVNVRLTKRLNRD